MYFKPPLSGYIVSKLMTKTIIKHIDGRQRLERGRKLSGLVDFRFQTWIAVCDAEGSVALEWGEDGMRVLNGIFKKYGHLT